jgi:Cu(I)/Ag(I) efflux system membrane fusion protein
MEVGGARAAGCGAWAPRARRTAGTLGASEARRVARRRVVALGRALALAGALAGCGGEPPPVRVEGPGVTLEAALEPAAARVGVNRIEVALRDEAGAPLEGAQVAVAVRMPPMGSMPAHGGPAPVRERGRGRYEAEFEIPMGGTWQVEIEARTRAGEPVRAEGSLTTGTTGLVLRAGGASAAPAPAAGHEGHEGGAPPRAGGHEGHAGGAAAPASESRAPGEFALAPARVQEVGVRSAPAERRRVARSVRAAGLVGYDETALVDVSLKVRGWVGALYADAVGVRVERGAPLFTLYSPELYAAQEEYLQAVHSQRQARGTGAPDRADWRVRAARKRLALWDIGAGEIAAIERRGVPMEEVAIRSPVTGTVLEKDVVEGSAFEPGQRLLRIVPLDRVWVEAQVYESEAPMVRVGTPAEVSLPYEPGVRFEGRVGFVYPTLSEGTRTLRVRVVLDNPEGTLRPGMWATVRLEGEAAERLVVPESAVLQAGERAFVFLDLGGGRFRPREVEVGMRSGGDVEIAGGLEAGERVVTSGTFLVASESRLRAALEQW